MKIYLRLKNLSIQNIRKHKILQLLENRSVILSVAKIHNLIKNPRSKAISNTIRFFLDEIQE